MEPIEALENKVEHLTTTINTNQISISGELKTIREAIMGNGLTGYGGILKELEKTNEKIDNVSKDFNSLEARVEKVEKRNGNYQFLWTVILGLIAVITVLCLLYNTFYKKQQFTTQQTTQSR